ncbi:MAG: hypothetical protein K2Q01_04205 [Rickettsiales bacterium]|nr:hypothetical protein [Rickettsiales bacterium]
MKTHLSFRRPLSILLVIVALYAAYLAALSEKDLPPLQNGDLIFQTTWTNQSIAIALASASWYIHTGVVADNGNGNYTVVQAGLHVTETPLSEWIDQGIFRRFTVYRYEGLTPEQGGTIVHAARQYIGLPYDFYFTFGKDAIYCSELDYRAYHDAGVSLATPERIGSLYINNRFVRSVIEQRWKNYPACASPHITFEECYDRIMDGELVTPQAVANDTRLRRIFSNYP